ncbi:MAG: ATP-binding protein [Verrucomicrobiota bacterium]|nr:ATP-binding protein [Verrucomicrobiota bacterium]
MLINREKYIKQVEGYIDTPIIKIFTGMRRSGKSCLMKLLIEKLKKAKVSKNNIIYINKESLEFDNIKNYVDLNEYILQKSKDNKKTYLFIDEIQEIEQWEKCITSLFASDKFDIYLTGSNAHLLSSELATLLSGRFVEISVYTLSFQEFLTFRGNNKGLLDDEFQLFLKYGGLPVLHNFKFDDELIYNYIKDVLSTIILKDIVERNQIRNVRLLQDILRFAFDNVGNLFSAKKVSDYLKSQNIKVGIETVQNYLSFFCNAFILHKVSRYDIKGKRFLEFNEKFFLNDIGLHDAILGLNQNNIAGVLENIVYLELLYRGYTVSVGKKGNKEIDFIAEKNKEKIYIQVSYLLASQNTIDREFSALEEINDHNPKLVLSLDKYLNIEKNGIKHQNIIKYLTEF